VSAPYVIVWDLDGTLGDFEPLQGRGDDGGPVTVRLRPGLAEALRTLREAGFLHALLTLATPRYAELALRGAELRPFFHCLDGLGQRGKGDAAGLGELLGVTESERPHRMVFVGDHPYHDAPQDSRVLFHLEPLALARPAGELARLLLHLRDLGGGSLRGGFDRLGRRGLLRRLWPFGGGDGRPVYRRAAGLGRLVLVRRDEEAPVIGFAERPQTPQAPEERTFVPAEVMAQLKG
jgi:hypothetical protein